MTGRLTLKLALAVATGGIVGGLKTGNSVFISGLHTPSTHDRNLRHWVRHVRAWSYPQQSALLQWTSSCWWGRQRPASGNPERWRQRRKSSSRRMSPQKQHPYGWRRWSHVCALATDDQSFLRNQAGRKAVAFIVDLYIYFFYIDIGSAWSNSLISSKPANNQFFTIKD